MSWQRRARARGYTDVQLVKEAGRASQGCAPPPSRRGRQEGEGKAGREIKTGQSELFYFHCLHLAVNVK